MSETLDLIMEHLAVNLDEEGGSIPFPFNIEEFCRENDKRLSQVDDLLRKQREACAYEFDQKMNYEYPIKELRRAILSAEIKDEGE